MARCFILKGDFAMMLTRRVLFAAALATAPLLSGAAMAGETDPLFTCPPSALMGQNRVFPDGRISGSS